MTKGTKKLSRTVQKRQQEKIMKKRRSTAMVPDINRETRGKSLIEGGKKLKESTPMPNTADQEPNISGFSLIGDASRKMATLQKQ